MSQTEQPSLAAEVEKRLDNLFQEEERPEAPGAQQNLVDSLKAVVLSMEWEISDKELKKLLVISDQLKKEHKADPMLLPFAQLLSSLGRYIDKYRGNADPEAIKLVTSTFEAFEKALQDNSLSAKEKKQLLAAQVEKFKKLKKKISTIKKKAAAGRKSAPPKRATKPKAGKAASAKAPDSLLESIREMIREEFDRFRGELKAMLEQAGGQK